MQVPSFQTIFLSAPDAVIVIGEKGNIMNWNSKAEVMFGWTSQEVIGKSLADTIIPDHYKSRHEEGMRNYMETGIGPVLNKTIEIEARRRDGSEFDISLSISPSRLEDQQIFIGFIRDITEERKAAENTRYNSLLLENVSDAVISTDENMIIKTWNVAAEKMYGYTIDEVIGQNIELLQLKLSADIRRKRQNILKQDGYYKDEYISVDKFGNEIIILASVNVINIGEKIKGYVAVHRDITIRKKLEAQLRIFNKDLSRLVEEKTAEIKKSEEKYRSLIEQAADAIALFDDNNRILDINESATQLLGYTRDELCKMSLTHVLSPPELSTNPIRFDLLEKGESTIKPRRMIRKDGTVVETEVHAKKLSDGSYLALIRDLTERKKAEVELQQSYDAIRDLVSHLQDIREEERLRIAQEIHDELGQQLTVMKMDVSWLDKKLGEGNPQVRERTEGLKNMLDTTVKTVRRIASELRPSILDDMGLAVAIEWHINEMQKRTGIQIDFETSKEEMNLPDAIKIGVFRIVQESLTNVARYAKAESVKIKLDRRPESLHLFIRDDGIGFDQSRIAVKKTLGILGMKERAAKLGGNLQISSSPGKGTSISVEIPVRPQPVPSSLNPT